MPNDSSSSYVPAALSHFMDGEVPSREVELGLWDDAFLTLGGRLGAIYGNSLTRLTTAAYYVVHVGRTDVQVTTVQAGQDRWVRAMARVKDEAMETRDPSGNVQITRRDGEIWAECDVPFREALGPNLQRAVRAVGRAVSASRVPLPLNAAGA